MTKHHRLPKQFKFTPNRFFREVSENPILHVAKEHHRAWNLLTNNSSMSLPDIANSLSRFIPNKYKFIVVERNPSKG